MTQTPFPPMAPIRVDRDGLWAWDGRPMVHDGILRYLKQHLELDSDGNYWVAVGPSRVPVLVADAPLSVEALLDGPPRLRLDDDSEEPLSGALVLEMSADHRLFAPVKAGRYRALLSRAAHHQVWEGLEEDGDGHVLTLGASRVPVLLRS